MNKYNIEIFLKQGFMWKNEELCENDIIFTKFLKDVFFNLKRRLF